MDKKLRIQSQVILQGIDTGGLIGSVTLDYPEEMGGKAEIWTGAWSLAGAGNILVDPNAKLLLLAEYRVDDRLTGKDDLVDPLYLAMVALLSFHEKRERRVVVSQNHEDNFPPLGFFPLGAAGATLTLRSEKGEEFISSTNGWGAALLPCVRDGKDWGSYLTRSMFLQLYQQEIVRHHPHRALSEILNLSPLGILLQGSRSGLTREQRALLL